VRFAEQSVAAGVKHLVKLSQFAADEASPVRFLRYHAVDFTFLRSPRRGTSSRQSAMRVSAVDVRDIAAVATRALTESGHEGKTYTITGPAAVTHTEMAGAIAEAIGRPVAFIDVPSDAFAGALKAAGVPAWQVDGLVEDYAHYARGEAATISPHVREVTGADPRDMGQFAKDYARAFVGA